MSDERQTLNNPPVDQTTRGIQAEDNEPVQTEEDVVEALRRQLADLEERDRVREAEVAKERRLATEERHRRQQAEHQAREADTRATQATNIGQRTADDARLSEVTVALDARNAQMESLRSAYQAAFAEGAGDKMAEINSKMSILGAQIVSLDAGKAQLEQRQKAAAPAPAPQQPQQPSRDELMRGMTTLEREWADRHPEYFQDRSFQERAADAANYAVNKKHLARDSQEYIDFVNQELGLSESAPSPPPRQERSNGAAVPAGRTADASAAPSSPPERRMVAAPAGGSVQNTSRGDGEAPVYLTREDKEMARIQGVPEKEWARHKQDLLREGLIGPGARNRG